MLRTVLASLLLALAFVPATAAAATTEAILRDCEQDGIVQGDYTRAELREALRNIGTDLDQYGDCRGALADASFGNAPTADATGGVTGDPTSTGSGAGVGGLDGGSAANGAGSGGAGRGAGVDAAIAGLGGSDSLETAGNVQEQQLLDGVRATPPSATEIAGQPIAVGPAGFVATPGARALPTPLLVALTLLTVAALATAAPTVRRRVPARRSVT